MNKHRGLSFHSPLTTVAGFPKNDIKSIKSHCLYLDLNGKRPGMTSDVNFSSYLIGRSGYGWLFPFPVGGNGNDPIYPLLSTVLFTWTEPETCFG